MSETVTDRRHEDLRLATEDYDALDRYYRLAGSAS